MLKKKKRIIHLQVNESILIIQKISVQFFTSETNDIALFSQNF